MKTVLELILFPMLPLMGLIFTLVYFSICFYVYNYPNIDNDTICDWGEINKIVSWVHFNKLTVHMYVGIDVEMGWDGEPAF